MLAACCRDRRPACRSRPVSRQREVERHRRVRPDHALDRGMARCRAHARAPRSPSPAPPRMSAPAGQDPVRFSVSTGLRLCGIADLSPSGPCEKNSSASSTSVRCMWRISTAMLDEDAMTASVAEEHRVAVARDDLGGDRLGCSPIFSPHALRPPDRYWRRCRPRPKCAPVAISRALPFPGGPVAVHLGIEACASSGRRSSARRGCRGSGRCAPCPCARTRGSSAPRAAVHILPAGGRRRAQLHVEQVSSTSDDVMP
jgi:hypothetical protein